ncbi:right-handed parallel beta-helix repeat-containing protein [Bradyrhizobium sp. SZCCHNRI20481]|uniref:right-handed parallel beta-helix repeat-containing protein n=1 Tax=Bradyrhizobium sp. SZCCHNRI20481 TaxID=3057286 RepID=UPI0029162699|nr:right-handed parallel beta-helix repeat-containing protein [Bradyrhizobium sp. SZCCHNRI20481]
MKHLFTALFAAAIVTLASGVSQADSGKTWYVNQASKSAGDGHAWNAPFHSLQDALSAASKNDEIWVARGTYYPDATDQTKSFVLKEDIAVYGGFSGNETARQQRDFRRNVTILSGNIGKGDKTKNTKTIIMGANRAILDGFTVSDSYGTDKPRMHLVPADILKNDMVVGGGMRNFMTSPIVRNVVFKNNYSPKGGAVYNVHKAGADQAAFINVDFIDNVAELRGGGVSNDLGAMPRFINCRFIGNRSNDKGGGLYNDFAASPLVFNTLFTGNSAVSAGGVGNDGGSAPLLVNVTIVGNKASSALGPDLYQGTGANSNPILIRSVVGKVYNWHEDIVSEVGSLAPAGSTLPLTDFIPISNLKGELEPVALKSAPAYARGYQPGLDGALLLKNGLVEKLVQIYVKNSGAVEYQGEYIRPAVSAKAVSAPVIYVVPDNPAKAQDGLSWATGFSDLQAAIDLASASKAAVWIKAGTYRPAKKDGRIAAFILYDGVKLYGGFAGTETALEQRRAAGARTILSARAAKGGYRYAHVLYGADDALLDGLTLRDGRAVGRTYNGKGGGLLAYHAGKKFLPREAAIGFKMTLHNCRFEHNEALEGGAIYAYGKANLTISDTVFEGNRAVYGGANVNREGVVVTCQKCSFTGNRASQDGGATYEDYGSHVSYEQARFTANSARHQGGAIYEISRASQLEATVVGVSKSAFVKNKARDGASIYNLDGSTLTITNSTYPAKTVYSRTPSESK